jgi:hypothetical protein
MSKPRSRILRRILTGPTGLVALLCLLLWGQVNAAEFCPGALTSGLGPVQDLNGEWIDVDRGRVQVPFADMEADRMDLGRRFEVPGYDSLPDTLYLYFGGLAWTAEVRLNGALLKVTDQPFAEHLLPLRKEWLTPRDNRLEITLRRDGPGFRFQPRNFAGIFREVFLLAPDPNARQVRIPKRVDRGSRAVVLASWDSENGFLHDTVVLKQALQGMFSYPYEDPVWFAFPPSSHAMDLVARSGRSILTDLAGVDSLCFYNTFPIEADAGDFSGRFWRDAKGRPTAAYGSFISRTELDTQQLRSPDKLALLILLLIPVIMLLLLKLIAPRLYAALPEYITKTKIYLELIAGSKFLKDEQRLLMNLMRMVLVAVTASLYIYYVGLSGNWDRLNILSSESFLFQYFDGTAPTLYLIFLQVIAVVVGLNLVKYLFLNVSGGIFRVYGLAAMVQNLDIFAAFPLNLLPLAPAAIIFFLDAGTGSILLVVWNICLLIYFIRRLVLIYGGLSKLFQFSTGIKFLYICSLEIAPWVFLI